MATAARKAINRRHYLKNRERYQAEKLAYHHANKHRKDKVKLAAYNKAWRAENPEKARGTADQRRVKQNRKNERYRTDPEFREKLIARGKTKRGTIEHKIKWRAFELRRKYGLTIEEYERRFAEQLGKCAICGESEHKGKDTRKFLHVDHCHATKRIRGLLCQNCNRGIGFFRDSPDRLAAAIAYLQRA